MTENERHNELRKGRAAWYRTLSIALIGLGVFQNVLVGERLMTVLVCFLGGLFLQVLSDWELQRMKIDDD